eukprot:TRINITY_DN10867_c0_g1_i1.p1 TRINITY_DN10867_c0_g1~~TRINITY_DN10867_c0_g1_i1.p1  ORF type:complete len:122 (+),score=18.30 TRINITY_DN10867_c0_g1_i1:29-394(+)
MTMTHTPVFGAVFSAFVAIGFAISPPTFPTQFEASITNVNNGRTSTGTFWWSVDLRAERYDLESNGGQLTDIKDYNSGLRYQIVKPDNGETKCEVQQISHVMPFNFSGFNFGGEAAPRFRW